MCAVCECVCVCVSEFMCVCMRVCVCVCVSVCGHVYDYEFPVCANVVMLTEQKKRGRKGKKVNISPFQLQLWPQAGIL